MSNGDLKARLEEKKIDIQKRFDAEAQKGEQISEQIKALQRQLSDTQVERVRLQGELRGIEDVLNPQPTAQPTLTTVKEKPNKKTKKKK